MRLMTKDEELRKEKQRRLEDYFDNVEKRNVITRDMHDIRNDVLKAEDGLPDGQYEVKRDSDYVYYVKITTKRVLHTTKRQLQHVLDEEHQNALGADEEPTEEELEDAPTPDVS